MSRAPRCPVHDQTDCSPLLNVCSRLTVRAVPAKWAARACANHEKHSQQRTSKVHRAGQGVYGIRNRVTIRAVCGQVLEQGRRVWGDVTADELCASCWPLATEVRL